MRKRKPYIVPPARTDPDDRPEPPCAAYAVVSDGWGRRIRLVLATLPYLDPRLYAQHVAAIINTASLGAGRPRWWGVVRRGRANARSYQEIDDAVLQYALSVASPPQLAALDRATVRSWLRSPSAAVRRYAIVVLRHTEAKE